MATVIPNLFIAGAPKCGTSSLHYYLGQHPDIYMSSPKELYFFMSDIQKPFYTEDQYYTFFAPGAGKRYAGESTTVYIYSPKAVEEIRRLSPKAKVIIMVRNPVDIIDALYWQNTRNGNEKAPTLREALRRGGEGDFFMAYRDMATLSPHISRYKDAFGENLMLINFDRFSADPGKITKDVFRFLGVDDSFAPKLEIQNPNAKIRVQWFENLLNKPPLKAVLFLQKIIPSPVLRRKIYDTLKVLNHTPEKRPGMEPGLLKELKEQFKEEIGRLSRLLGEDLSGWYTDHAGV